MPLNIDWQQILLHLLNFVILFAGLWLLLYKPVRKFMNSRREHYEKMDADAEKKSAEIDEKRSAARRELDGYETMRKQAAEEEADAILAAARESAAREKERAVAEARGEIAGLVTQATEKIVLRESASEAYDQFLDAAEKSEKKDGGDA